MKFWEEVRQRAALERYHLGLRSLKKILTHDEPPGYRQRQPRRKQSLVPFLSVIHQILEVGRPHGLGPRTSGAIRCDCTCPIRGIRDPPQVANDHSRRHP